MVPQAVRAALLGVGLGISSAPVNAGAEIFFLPPRQHRHPVPGWLNSRFSVCVGPRVIVLPSSRPHSRDLPSGLNT